jgi:hypothetical protein
VSPVKYELGFYISEDGILHSHRSENLKSLHPYIIEGRTVPRVDSTRGIAHNAIPFTGTTPHLTPRPTFLFTGPDVTFSCRQRGPRHASTERHGDVSRNRHVLLAGSRCSPPDLRSK